MADVADAAAGAEEHQVAFPEVSEAFHRAAFLELGLGIVRQVVAEFPENIACETGTVEQFGTGGAQPVGDAEECLGVVQELVRQFLPDGRRDGLLCLGCDAPAGGGPGPGLDTGDGVHDDLRPFPGAGDVRRIRQGKDDRGLGLLIRRCAPHESARRHRQGGQKEDSGPFHGCKGRKIPRYVQKTGRPTFRWSPGTGRRQGLRSRRTG